MSLSRHLSLFLLSLSFLTRLTPARVADSADMRAACLYFPAVGAVLGLILILPFALGLFALHPAVQAWIYVLASAWLTRALHLDGLADVCDALGSGAQNEQFHVILKDSRMGAFGAVGIALVIAGHIILATACFTDHHLIPLVFAPVFGRCLPVFLARYTPPHPKASLGAILSHAPLRACTVTAATFAFIFGVFSLGPIRTFLAFSLAAFAVLTLSRIATRHGGYNGDFLGFAILSGELAALAAAVVV